MNLFILRLLFVGVIIPKLFYRRQSISLLERHDSVSPLTNILRFVL